MYGAMCQCDLVPYPSTLMFVSNTDTTTSLSKDTSLMMVLMALLNSSTRPITYYRREEHMRGEGGMEGGKEGEREEGGRGRKMEMLKREHQGG